MSQLVAVINAGSSSLKFALYDVDTPVISGKVEGIGTRPASHATDASGRTLAGPDVTQHPPANPAEAASLLIVWLQRELAGREVAAIGHRVVHGGPKHLGPERVTPELLADLDALKPLAPLHQPHNLSPIRAMMEMAPGLAQIACFDTAFHHTIPEVERSFALPRAMTAAGIRRYGFHGLSYEYIASRLPELTPGIAGGRVIVAHLGNGASLCAMRAGRSMATTMGFSALDGLPMGTRCGELDAGVVLHLLQHEGMSASEIETLLYRKSGLLGVSGISSDVRDLLASTAPEAREALEILTYRIARHIGALAAVLGGLDGIVFTAGVGENAAPIRAAVMERCAWLGVSLDAAANARNALRISDAGCRVAVHVISTDENLMIARHTRAVLAKGSTA